MPQFITDGDFTTAQPVSAVRYSAPFSQYGINNLYVLEQDFVINVGQFAPLAIDTAHPTIAGFYLAVETPYQPTSLADVVRWTRRYASLPSSFSRPGGTYNYTFPVMYTGVNDTSRLFPKPLTVNSRIQVDFFRLSDPNTITVIEPQRYVIITSLDTDATSQWGQPVVTDAGFGLAATVPSLTTYKSWIATGTEIVAEASKITPNWMGNIHMRETIYVKAH